MNFLKFIKHIFTFLLIFLLGVQNSYSKTELVLLQNQASFSIEQNQSFKSLEKEVQPNIGFLKEKSKFGVSEGIFALNQHNFSEQSLRYVANTVDDAFDALLDGAKAFDDNVIDIAEVGLHNWKTFQNRVSTQLKTLYPNSKIGSQITLDVTYIENGVTKVKTIIPDDLIQVEVNGIRKYKIIDAKTSSKDLVNKTDLTSTCTKNQKDIYPLVDGGGTHSGVTISKVEMRGNNAKNAFESSGVDFINGKAQIQLETGVEFWVNSSTTNFTQYLVRPRIK